MFQMQPSKVSNKFVRDKADKTRLLFRKEYICAEHTDTEHFYRCYVFDGHPLYRSVTTKTSVLNEKYLKKWAVDKAIEHIKNNRHRLAVELDTVVSEAEVQHELIFKEAGDIGTEAHEIIEAYIWEWISTGERPDDMKNFIKTASVDSRVMSCVVAAEKFLSSMHIVPVYPELLVGSPHIKIAGTLDFLAYVGELVQEPKEGTTPLPISDCGCVRRAQTRMQYMSSVLCLMR